MKIKVSVLLLTGLLLSLSAYSQLKFGITTGVISASTNISTSPTDPYNHFIINSSSSRIGYQGGIKAQLFIGDLFFQSEALISSLSSKILINDIATKQTNQYYYQKYTNLSIPVLIGYKIGMFRINAGPVANFVLNNNPSGTLKFSSPNPIENIKFHYYYTQD